MAVLLGLSLLLQAPTVSADVVDPAIADTLCDRAEYLLLNRHLAPPFLDSACGLLVRARQVAVANERCLHLSARVCMQMGERAAGKTEKLRCYVRARAIADTLRNLNNLNPAGHLWWAVASGRIGQLRGMASSALMARSLRQAFQRAIELDSQCVLAYYALARLHAETPGILGGSMRKAEELLKRGLAADPNYTLLRLELARLWVRQKRGAEARAQLAALLRTTRPSHPAEFELDDRPAAEALLQELSSASFN